MFSNVYLILDVLGMALGHSITLALSTNRRNRSWKPKNTGSPGPQLTGRKMWEQVGGSKKRTD